MNECVVVGKVGAWSGGMNPLRSIWFFGSKRWVVLACLWMEEKDDGSLLVSSQHVMPCWAE